MPDAFALANAFVRIRPDTTGFRAEAIAGINAALAGVKPTVKVGLTVSPADVAGLRRTLAALAKPITIKVKPDLSGLSALQAAINRLAAQMKNFTVGPLGGGGGKGGGSVVVVPGPGGGGGNVINNYFTGAPGGGGGGGGANFGRFGFGLFGGAAGAGIISAFTAVHLVLDLVIEAIIAVTAAAAALAVGLYAASAAAQDIYTHLHAVQQVSSALNVNIRPLTGQFAALQQAMAPQVIEAYGGGLAIVQRNTGILGTVAHQVVDMFDTWIAKIDVWTAHQGTFGQILEKGVGFLAQFAHIIGVVGQGIGNLIKDDPGIVHYLLDVIGGFASLFKWFTALPGPMVKFALGFHAIVLYGTVAVGLITKLAESFGVLSAAQGAAARSALSYGNILKGIFSGPGLLIVAIASLALWAYRANQASAATDNFINKINFGLAVLPASQAIVRINTDIKALTDRLHGIQAIKNPFAELFSPGWKNFVEGIKGIFTHGLFPSEIFGSQQSHNIAAITSEITKLGGEQHNLFVETGRLVGGYVTFNTVSGRSANNAHLLGGGLIATYHAGMSLANAWALMDAAGVRANDSLAVMAQKVANLERGYFNMGVRGALLAATVNAVTFATLQQQSAVASVTGGWDAFFNTVAGGEKAFEGFAQNMAAVRTAARASGASITGLSANSIALRSAFSSAAAGASAQLDSLTMLASAYGAGAQGTALLGQATKDLVKELLPAAKDSSTMTTILYALAQRGGYRGADSFKALAKWVGSVPNPMKNLDKIVETLTKHAGSLLTDVRNLSTALGQNLNNAMATALSTATNAQGAFTNFAKAIFGTGTQSKTTKTAADKLAASLVEQTGSVSRAHDEFITFATVALHLTQKQADTLWKQTFPSLQAAIDKLHSKHIDITASVHGSGNVTASFSGAAIIAHVTQEVMHFGATGMKVPGSGSGDKVHIMAEPGEAVVPKRLVPAVAPFLGAHHVPGFQDGGFVGVEREMGALTPRISSAERSFEKAMLTHGMKAGFQNFMSEFATAAKAAFVSQFGRGFMDSGARSGSALVAQEFAATVLPRGWSFADLLALWNRESGWNSYAVNPSSGAYGIPQALGHGHPFNLGDYKAQIMWGINYIAQRYGNSQNAWGHEVAFGWYDKGGRLKPGWTMAYNGTGRPERVIPHGTERTQITLEFKAGPGTYSQFLVNEIRKQVQLKGGGDVQVAFGSP